jgi:regulator of protease activity HflC (stomatin/prohibitin superfamily)
MPSLLSWVLGVMFLPLTLLASWVVVHPQEEKVVLIWGTLWRVLKTPGLSFINLFGRKVITISTKQQAVEIHKTTVADANANPIIVAGICTFRVVDSMKAALHVEDYLGFVRSQAAAVLKQVASKYPYESADGHGLKDEAAKIGQEMVGALAKKVSGAGVEVLAYELSDLSYAPEIAQAMLVRQQAQALVGARKIIVEGAVEIVKDAMTRLRERDIAIDPSQQSRVVGNLLAIICGEARVQPTYEIQDYGSQEMGDSMKSVVEHLKAIEASLKAQQNK